MAQNNSLTFTWRGLEFHFSVKDAENFYQELTDMISIQEVIIKKPGEKRTFAWRGLQYRLLIPEAHALKDEINSQIKEYYRGHPKLKRPRQYKGYIKKSDMVYLLGDLRVSRQMSGRAWTFLYKEAVKIADFDILCTDCSQSAQQCERYEHTGLLVSSRCMEKAKLSTASLTDHYSDLASAVELSTSVNMRRTMLKILQPFKERVA